MKSFWCKKYYDALFLSGCRSSAYFQGLGLSEGQIWRGVDVVDDLHFSHTVASRDIPIKEVFLSDRYFICVARHNSEKNLVRLLEAYKYYRIFGGTWGLLMLGDGPQRDELEHIVLREDLPDIEFQGWVQYDQLPKYYQKASALILPSISEPWGLVVNEAMNAGLPVLVSRKCGCLPELCHRGINGYDFDPLDIDEMCNVMLRISSVDTDLARMGNASKTIIANYTPSTWANALADCISSVKMSK